MGELTLGIVFMVFLILFLSSDVGKEINDKINNSPEVRARRALEELERQQQQTINEQTKQTEAVKTQVINTMPQKKSNHSQYATTHRPKSLRQNRSQK